MAVPPTLARAPMTDRLADLLGPLNLLVLLIPVVAAGMSLSSSAARLATSKRAAAEATDQRATVDPAAATPSVSTEALERARTRSSASASGELPIGYGL